MLTLAYLSHASELLTLKKEIDKLFGWDCQMRKRNLFKREIISPLC
jgi:hypothetical protein